MPDANALPSGVVTFLLTDIEGSTALWDTAPEAMSEALQHHEKIVADAVAANAGTLVKGRGEGDSTLSVFARASDAGAAAVCIKRGIAGADWPDGIRLPTRIALHTGEAQLRDDDYFGSTVNRAARIRGLATGGQILCSRTTADLIADSLAEGLAVTELGSHHLRGLRRTETVFEIGDASESSREPAREAVESRDLEDLFPTFDEQRPRAGSVSARDARSFIGRAHEVEEVRRRWALARQHEAS